ncbi:MAG: DUF5777 family beta-barrel protein [Bacteroidota bacterium]|nr:DUF5777 family beta-barrel protein [Bacteroidota bacterium]
MNATSIPDRQSVSRQQGSSSVFSRRTMLTAIYWFAFLILTAGSAVAQEDLLKELENSQPPSTDYALATFKGTRLVNGHSIETKSRGDLEFIFAHRFGRINEGIYEFFGLDEAYVRLGLDYGFTDNLSASIGRNSVDKTVDAYLKYKLLRQRRGATSFPVTMTALAGTAYKASPRKDEVPEGFTSIDRLAYVGQLLIARKFSPRLSLQLSPTIIHKNAVDQRIEDNTQLSIGAGGRFKLTKSVALTGEYYHRLNVPDANPYFNTFGLGVDIETGGHVFQLVFTNTTGLTERAFITETEGDFGNGDIHFGFNITRTFHLKRKKQDRS